MGRHYIFTDPKEQFGNWSFLAIVIVNAKVCGKVCSIQISHGHRIDTEWIRNGYGMDTEW